MVEPLPGWRALSQGRRGTSRGAWGCAWRWVPLAMLLVIAPQTWAGSDAAPPRTPLRLMLAWQPQAQFAGYYVALEQGFYREAGVELTILSADRGRSALTALRAGEVDLAVVWLAAAIRARAEGTPLVNVAQLLPRSSVVLIARASSGVQRLSDLGGRRVGVWRGDAALPVEALLRKQNLEVERVPQSTTINLFLRGGVEAMSGMLYNEYHLLIDAGLEPEAVMMFPLAAHGIDIPEDGLYALERTAREQFSAIAAFVAATRRGWQQAFADPEGALDIVLRRQRAEYVPANRSHQRWMLEQIRAVMGEPGENGWDWRLGREDVERVARLMQRLEMIDAVPSDIERLMLE